MIFLWGASGHAKVVIEIIETTSGNIGGLCDQDETIRSLLGYPVNPHLPESFDTNKDQLLISIGNNLIRKKIAEANPYLYAKAIHPSATISPRAVIDTGTVVMAGVSVNSETQIGQHAILNTNCSIDHDCILQNYVHISPQAALAGNVKVGEGTHIGIGACIIQGITIGKWATIGAGAVIIKDIPDYAVVVGNPGKIIKYNRQ